MDHPKLLRDEAAREERLSQIAEAHVARLTDFVDDLRDKMGPEAAIPYFDPWDGGVGARALFLLEAPGPKARNSGFVSMNNPDETAKNFFELIHDAGIDRRSIAIWNTVPWYIGSGTKIRPASSADIASGVESLANLFQLMPTPHPDVCESTPRQPRCHSKQLADCEHVVSRRRKLIL